MGNDGTGRLMALGFHKTDAGRFVAAFDEQERELLRHLAQDLQEFVGPEQQATDPFSIGILESASISEDPALARLFPDAYDLDTEAAEDFRRFTEIELREAKASHLKVIADTIESSGDKTVLNEAQARSWMIGLNDLRLVIGTRLHLDDDEEPDMEPEYVEQLTAIYQWLTWLQESVVGSLMGEIIEDEAPLV